MAQPKSAEPRLAA
jgi:dodecin